MDLSYEFILVRLYCLQIGMEHFQLGILALLRYLSILYIQSFARLAVQQCCALAADYTGIHITGTEGVVTAEILHNDNNLTMDQYRQLAILTTSIISRPTISSNTTKKNKTAQ